MESILLTFGVKKKSKFKKNCVVSSTLLEILDRKKMYNEL